MNTVAIYECEYDTPPELLNYVLQIRSTTIDFALNSPPSGSRVSEIVVMMNG
jgi:hypothetical protein